MDYVYDLITIALVIFVMWVSSSMASRKGYQPIYWAISTFIFAPMLLVLWCLPKKNAFFETSERSLTEKIIEGVAIVLCFVPVILIISLFYDVFTYKPH